MTDAGNRFYDDLENYTNFEEYQNGTNPVNADTDGDIWEDGSEVYHQDQDDDSMWAGWEYYFGFDPFDPADANVDSDGDGFVNKCENKWNSSHPKDPTSFPSQESSAICSTKARVFQSKVSICHLGYFLQRPMWELGHFHIPSRGYRRGHYWNSKVSIFWDTRLYTIAFLGARELGQYPQREILKEG